MGEPAPAARQANWRVDDAGFATSIQTVKPKSVWHCAGINGGFGIPNSMGWWQFCQRSIEDFFHLGAKRFVKRLAIASVSITCFGKDHVSLFDVALQQFSLSLSQLESLGAADEEHGGFSQSLQRGFLDFD